MIVAIHTLRKGDRYMATTEQLDKINDTVSKKLEAWLDELIEDA